MDYSVVRLIKEMCRQRGPLTDSICKKLKELLQIRLSVAGNNLQSSACQVQSIDFLLPSGGSKALGPVGRNPVIAQSIICLFSISTDFEVSVSSLSGQAMKALPARLLATCKRMNSISDTYSTEST